MIQLGVTWGVNAVPACCAIIPTNCHAVTVGALGTCHISPTASFCSPKCACEITDERIGVGLISVAEHVPCVHPTNAELRCRKRVATLLTYP